MSASGTPARWYRYWEREGGGSREGSGDIIGDDGFHVEPSAMRLHVEPSPGVAAPDGPAAGEAGAKHGPTTPAPTWPAWQARRPDGAWVITVANQKGGVGKTTTAVSVAAALPEAGCRILLLDLDPQANATSGLGVRVHPGQPTIYDVLVDGLDARDAITPSAVPNLSVLPASIDLAGAEIELVSALSREQQLRRALEPVRPDFDIVLVDCPPSLGLLTINGLSACHGVVIPIQCEYYALEGLGALRRTVDLIRANLNPGLSILGFVMTMLDGRTRLGQQVIDEVRAHFGALVLQTRIPRTVRLAEAPSFGQPITVFDPTSRGAMAYRRLARELLERLAGAPATATG